MRTSMLFTVGAVAVALAGPVLAQPPAGGGGGRGLPDFAAMDTNKDGKVTKAELTAALPEQAKTRADMIFERIDTNKDGAISAAERAAAPARRGPPPPQ